MAGYNVPLTLEKAREIQAERQKSSARRFIFWAAFLIIANALAIVFVKNGSAVTALGIVSAVILIWQTVKSRFFMFLQPKEYSGTVRNFQIEVEAVKDNLSGNPGDTYRTHDEKVCYMIIDVGGGVRKKKFAYSGEFENLAEGTEVTVLRFIDRPVIRG